MLPGLEPEPGPELGPLSYPPVPVPDPDLVPLSDPLPVSEPGPEPEAVVLPPDGSVGTKRWSRLRLVLARVSDAWMLSPDWMMRVELEASEHQVVEVVVDGLHWSV